MNSATATAETESPAEVEFYKAEIRRMSAELEHILVDLEESNRHCDRLGAVTQARLEEMKAFIRAHYPSSPFHP